MKKILKSVSVALTVMSGSVIISPPVYASSWPEKPIKITIPWKAGAGAANFVTRQLQKTVAQNNLINQPITIFNVGGALPVGMRQFLKAQPDGYNFMVMHTAILTLEATGKIDFGYKDLVPVVRLGQFCMSSVVSKKSNITSLDQLLRQGKDQPNKLIHGANLGAVNHAFGMLVERLNPGTKFRFVQTGGDATTYPELASGRVQVGGLSSSAVKKFVMGADGKPNPDTKLNLLAYAGAERSPMMPNVPTFKELGHDLEFCVDLWYFAPKGTSKEAIDGFSNLVKKALAEQDMQDALTSNALVGNHQDGDALQQSLAQQHKDIFSVLKK